MDKRFFFEKYGISERDLEKYLGAALSAGGDYADLYFEYLTSTSLSVDESMVKSASQGITAGCGVRVVAGERTGYAYTDDLAPERILHAARTAALIASGPAKTPIVNLKQNAGARAFIPWPLRRPTPSWRRRWSWSSARTRPRAPTTRASRKCAPATPTSCAACWWSARDGTFAEDVAAAVADERLRHCARWRAESPSGTSAAAGAQVRDLPDREDARALCHARRRARRFCN